MGTSNILLESTLWWCQSQIERLLLFCYSDGDGDCECECEMPTLSFRGILFSSQLILSPASVMVNKSVMIRLKD